MPQRFLFQQVAEQLCSFVEIHNVAKMRMLRLNVSSGMLVRSREVAQVFLPVLLCRILGWDTGRDDDNGSRD